MEKIEAVRLCDLYNGSDIDAISYIVNRTDDTFEKENALKLLRINNETTIGYGLEHPSPDDESYYHTTFWAILNKYGITKMQDGRACIEGVHYPSGV